MSQSAIMLLLEKSNKKLSAKQISEKVKTTRSTTHLNLVKLRNQKDVKWVIKKVLGKNHQTHDVYFYWV